MKYTINWNAKRWNYFFTGMFIAFMSTDLEKGSYIWAIIDAVFIAYNIVYIVWGKDDL